MGTFIGRQFQKTPLSGQPRIGVYIPSICRFYRQITRFYRQILVIPGHYARCHGIPRQYYNIKNVYNQFRKTHLFCENPSAEWQGDELH